MKEKVEPIKQKEILESKMQISLLKKSLKKLIKHINVKKGGDNKNLNTVNYNRMRELLLLRNNDLVSFNIVTYGLAFSSVLLFSGEFSRVINSGMVDHYVSLMENQDYWFETNDDTFSIEVAVLFIYQFFLNLYKEIHIDFSIIESLIENKEKLNNEMVRIIKKIDEDDKIRLSDWFIVVCC